MGVATAVAIGGLAVSAASTTNSFIQAGKQKKAQRAAEAKAAEAMAEARKKLEVNFAEELSIKKEPYELEREAMLAQGALAIQQGGESDRGAEATAGRVQMAMNEGQAGIRTAMGQELMGIEQQIINEDSRLRDVGVQLDLGEVEGAQLAARDAEEARAAAITEGMQGLQSMASQGLDMVPLFQKTASAKQVGKMQKASGTDQAGFQKATASMANEKGFSGLAGVGAMDQNAFNATMSGYSKDQLKQLDLLMKQKAKGLALKAVTGGLGF
jgi:hypothetical protein